MLQDEPQGIGRSVAKIMALDMEKAIINGFGRYDKPGEAYFCAATKQVYKGKRYGKDFEGIPERDENDGEGPY